MIPVSFGGRFGWLHPGAGRRGVVLCSPLGHEAIGTHRGWLELAQRLAAQGLHVLRFDHHGTGDSAGEGTDPDRLAAWREGVLDAAALLRERCGVDRVTLAGLRFGATLAALACSDVPGLEALVLLAPVVAGRAYLRELRLLSSTWHEANFGTRPPPSPDGGLVAVGTAFDADTVAAIGAVDLRGGHPFPPCRVLLMEAAGPAAAALAASLGARGCAVDTAPFPGRAEFLQEPVTAMVPREAFATLCAWVGPGDGPATALPHPVPRLPPASLPLPGATETPLHFGPEGRLFGVLCRPDSVAPARRAVVMINTGRSHHVGDARLFVTLARRLAASGVASLRMDVGGLGDSPAAPGAPEAPLYDLRSCRDVVAALDRLEAEGWREVSLLGVCSGAYLAFHAALADRRVAGLDLVNLQKFVWQEGGLLKVAARRPRRPAGFYAAALLRPGAWRRVLAGQVDVASLLLALARRPLARARGHLVRTLGAASGVQTEAGQVHRWFGALSARGVQTRLWYGDADPGWSELAEHFGRAGRGLARFRGASVQVIDSADHALQDNDARQRFVDAFCRVAAPAAERPPARPEAPPLRPPGARLWGRSGFRLASGTGGMHHRVP